jgi:hypothetical protein
MAYKTLLRSVFIFLLTAAALSAHADKVYVYHFDTFRTLKSDVYYDKIKVIDNRPDKSTIGYVRKEFNDKKVDLVTETELAVDFQEYISWLIKGQAKTDKELLLVVNDFKGEDQPNASECATFYVRIDGFAADGNSYKYIGTVDSLYEDVGGNASRLMRPLMNVKLLNIITRFVATNPASLDNVPAITLEQAENRAGEFKKDKPIYHTVHKEGLYKSYAQFLNSKPEPGGINVETYTLANGAANTYAYMKKENGRKGEKVDPKSFFAAYSKDTWYISDGNSFTKMPYENNEFYGYLRMKGVYDRTKEMTMLFGLVGALVSQALPNEAWGLYKARLDAEHKCLIPVKRVK